MFCLQIAYKTISTPPVSVKFETSPELTPNSKNNPLPSAAVFQPVCVQPIREYESSPSGKATGTSYVNDILLTVPVTFPEASTAYPLAIKGFPGLNTKA